MEEIHHTQKLDAPSGTAIISKGVKNNYTNWTLDEPTDQIHIKQKELELFLEHISNL
jgi:4-hydroxy-tetrahydrodipicolinate reductase